MSKSAAFTNDLLKLIFNGTPIPNLADNAASSPLTNLYVALHTADPGDPGDQTSNEIAYTGYARVAVARTSGGWTINGKNVSPTSSITFPLMSGGAGGTATHASVGVASAGAGKILYRGTLAPNILVVNGVPPIITTGSAINES